jgi:hypothetical protein
MAPEVVLTNNYDQKCDVFSFAIMMFQVLTNKIDNIYDDENEIKTEIKNNYVKLENELKETFIDKKENISYFNIEIRVANDPYFRPIISKRFKKKKYFEFLELLKKCWDHNPKERPNFNDISFALREIYQNKN